MIGYTFYMPLHSVVFCAVDGDGKRKTKRQSCESNRTERKAGEPRRPFSRSCRLSFPPLAPSFSGPAFSTPPPPPVSAGPLKHRVRGAPCAGAGRPLCVRRAVTTHIHTRTMRTDIICYRTQRAHAPSSRPTLIPRVRVDRCGRSERG